MKYLIVISLLVLGQICFSQDKVIEVEYDFYLNFSKSHRYDASLFILNNELLYVVNKKAINSNDKSSNVDFEINLFKNDSINNYNYTDLKNDSIYSRLRWFDDKVYNVKEKRTDFKWKITNETKKIGNYNCQKAIGNFRGRTYIAWFATELPINAGPWKIHGLPGLIVNATDTEGKIQFFFKSLRAIKKSNIPKLPNENAQIISLNEYAILLDSFHDELVKRIMSKMSRNTRIEIKKSNDVMEIFENYNR